MMLNTINLRRLLFAFITIIAALIITGCTTIKDFSESYFSGEDNAEPPTPLVAFTQKAKVQKLWTANIGKGSGKFYVKLAPVVEYNKVFTANEKGRVSAYDTTTGRQIWANETGLPITGGPGTGDGNIYIGTSDAEVVALDENSGKIRWKTRVHSEVLATPRSESGIVIIRTIDGKIAGLNSSDGKQVWLLDRNVPVLSLRGTSSPVLRGGLVFIGLGNGKLIALRQNDGRTLWEARVAIPSGRTELERMVDIDSDPLVDDQVAHVVTFQGKIATIEIRSGKILWRKDMSSHSGMSMDESNLYISDDKSHVWALDRRTSSSLWRQKKLHARQITSPAPHNGYIAVGDLEGYMHWLSKDDGSFVARARVDESRIIAPPVVEGNTLFVVTQNGTLAAFQIR